MKKNVASFLISLVSFTILSATTPADNHEQLIVLRKEVREDLTQNLLPYWSSRMVDKTNGGFFGRISGSNQVFPAAEKGGILNARILWTYSAAYRVIKDAEYLNLAKQAKDYIMTRFLDKEHGGAYRSLNAKGEPSDSRKQTYTQSFFLYGLSEYTRATADQEALQAAKNIFALLERYTPDKESNGYFEVFSRDWKRTHDQLIGEKSDKDEKTMNTHLHLMEAYANLYRVWPDKRVADRLKNLVEIFLEKIIDRNTSHLLCFFDRNWNSTSTVDSYGHDIEASWLLYEAAGLLRDPALLKRVKEVSSRIADAASEGFLPDGSMIYEKERATGQTSADRSWWVQAEAVVGYTNAYELTRNEKYLEKAIQAWNFTKRYLIDKKSGGWFSSVSAEGVGRGDKGGFWICPYHNGRMCLEIIERVKEK